MAADKGDGPSATPVALGETRAEISAAVDPGASRAFRNRVAVLLGVFALLLALVHMGAVGAQRDSFLSALEASDTSAYMQAKMVRETVLLANANMPGLDRDVRAGMLVEAMHLRQPDRSGHGIDQLQEAAATLRHNSRDKALASQGFELGEAALLLAILLLSFALIASSRRVVWGAGVLAGLGVVLAVLTVLAA